MHHVIICLSKKQQKDNPRLVRDRVLQTITENAWIGDSAESGADWMVIGGRWSGMLSRARVNQMLLRLCWIELDKVGLVNKIDPTTADRIKSEKIINSYFPGDRLKPVLITSQYRDLGHSSDVQIVDDMIWKRVLLPLKKKLSGDWIEDGILMIEEFDSSWPLKKSEVVGKMWAVVLDVHT